jgi:hypothetical protein
MSRERKSQIPSIIRADGRSFATTTVRKTMRTFIEECRDSKTGEIDCTKLAEKAANALDIYVGNNYDIPEEVFELAFELSEDDEQGAGL